MSKPVIVCVDDEKFVLDSLRTTLTQAFGEDYLIEIAEDGADALEVVRELLANGQEVPVVISDYVMPGMRGREVAAALATARPGLPTLNMSGYAAPGFEPDGMPDGDAGFLAKPFTAGQLLEAVDRAMGGGRQRGG